MESTVLSINATLASLGKALGTQDDHKIERLCSDFNMEDLMTHVGDASVMSDHASDSVKLPLMTPVMT